ncbi:unnamed protein product [Diplocarpon coronariae]|uniref:Uncharacterized protein n=1 Tax=Diplocarpon coronariae TaxID=2795749 RepID=A0A218YTH2_9HELO|nr:hypothetical protein B2J93_2887 [Marssonina coronariae]
MAGLEDSEYLIGFAGGGTRTGLLGAVHKQTLNAAWNRTTTAPQLLGTGTSGDPVATPQVSNGIITTHHQDSAGWWGRADFPAAPTSATLPGPNSQNTKSAATS